MKRSFQTFEISGLSSIWLPAAYRPERLSPSGKVRFDPDSGSLAWATRPARSGR